MAKIIELREKYGFHMKVERDISVKLGFLLKIKVLLETKLITLNIITYSNIREYLLNRYSLILYFNLHYLEVRLVLN